MSDGEPMESWRKIFRGGLAPLLSIQELNALHKGLTEDDPKLLPEVERELQKRKD